MNPKHYAELRENSELAAEILPQVAAKLEAAKQPSDLVVAVHFALDDMGIDDKDQALEVAKLLFYGWYIEVNEYYANGGE